MLRIKTLLLVPLLAVALAACGGGVEPAASAVAGAAGSALPLPTVSLAASPTTVASGASSILTWSSTDATSCSASGVWSGPKLTSGTQSTGPLTATSNFSLTCTGSGGSESASAAVTVSGSAPPPPLPTVSLAANPTSVANGGSSTLTWSSTNATSCQASGAWLGSRALSNSTGQSTGALTITSTFTLACTGLGGTASKSATVTVPTGAHNYITFFGGTETPISEGGAWHRANNVWTNVSTAGGIAFGTNGANDAFDDSYALLSGFGPEQQAEAVVFRSPSLVSNGITHEMELLLRFSDDAGNARGYECLFNYAGGVEIVRWNGPLGSFLSLNFTGGAGNLGRDLVSGDVIKATIVGNVISTYINGVLRAQTTDSTFATGQPGIGFFTRPAGVADNPNFGMTSYTASSN